MHYRNRIFDDTHPPPNDDLIMELENELGCALPADYRAFLLTCNGGVADYEINVCFDEESPEPLSFGTYFSLRHGGYETVPFELLKARNQKAFPKQGVLPIARDGGDSVLYLDMTDGYRVIAFVRGLPEWTGLRQQDTLVTVASSFEEYLDLLYVSDDTIVHAITNFDPKYMIPDLMAEWFDSGSPDWRERHANLWERHVSHRDDQG